MESLLDIREVVRRTGLTSRALRFYEAKGLLRPVRTHRDGRYYGAGELERIEQILALKRAGLTLSQISVLLAGGAPDLNQLIQGQLEALTQRQAEIAESRALLLSVRDRLERGEMLDLDTLCALIRQGEKAMSDDEWARIAARYVSANAQADWASRPMPEGFDQEDYSRRWRELGSRIEAAMPLSSDSPEAQAFVGEWFALLKPFSSTASNAMMQDVSRMYDDDAFWTTGADPGFSRAVWDFMKAATAARLERSVA